MYFLPMRINNREFNILRPPKQAKVQSGVDILEPRPNYWRTDSKYGVVRGGKPSAHGYPR